MPKCLERKSTIFSLELAPDLRSRLALRAGIEDKPMGAIARRYLEAGLTADGLAQGETTYTR